MKITNESMAKALGWKRSLPRDRPRGVWVDIKGNFKTCSDKPFTTSLDAIVWEIEARGLKWTHNGPYLNVRGERKIHCVEIYETCDTENPKHREVKTFRADTAPLALCAALLAFLKEKPC